MTTLAFIEGLGSPIHWLIVGLIALLLFGRRLPEVGRGLGKGISEFKKGLKDVTDDTTPSNSAQDPYGPSNTQRYQESAPRQMPPPPPQRMEHPSATGSGVKVSRRDMVD